MRDPLKDVRVVVNGCFDLFHDGHKDLFNYALFLCAYGEFLVLLNSDESVRALKGSDRPINSYSEREKNIRKYVEKWCDDHGIAPRLIVLKFSTEEELKAKIDAYRPDVIVKGNDRPDVRDIMGSDKWSVLITPRIVKDDGEIVSTTNILKEQDEQENQDSAE